ncbi:serine/threonine-protein kinase [Trichosporon asahii var. asahii CBS 2479]|uniref:non-specific serine/threonine protein kinase n=1 Tax=Trichosporon asahii var. asahii (strain ATCC 90039 / CBS 2479 / JCM 2466 / KCTC 7840 / NBRC 103889/ NCYC 2677 / UAMH 7654) TaxID=1186058 RepID=J4UG53_TRIAS|nr:serine/threonine-protein kinase [Trichosporon asahii var. asahii CBS 2479]EJT50425.1 serine/threonine-protein kinase [Trichosporon asahii var. asahii CBS 2479]
MNDNLLIALDRIKFYAQDALVTVTQRRDAQDQWPELQGREAPRRGRFLLCLPDPRHEQRAAVRAEEDPGHDGPGRRRSRHARGRGLPPFPTPEPDQADRLGRGAGPLRRRQNHLPVSLSNPEAADIRFLPFYTNGNLQDLMTQVSVTGNRIEEDRLLRLFHGTCLGLRAMHQYRLPAVNASYPPNAGDEESALLHSTPEPVSGEEGELVPYAHRDIKPGNIMLTDDDVPILMDFGSCINTMPYRAPELFDVKTGTTLDEKVDIWSLGCTLFAVAYGYSPFETDGASIAMAVLSGRYKHPAGYSERVTKLIDAMLVPEPSKRPDIQKVIDLTEAAMRQ